MNTIIIELCKEDRARLDAIIEGLSHRTEAPAPTEQSEPADAPAHTPIAEPTTVEPTPAESEVMPVSLAEFQKAVTMACAKGPVQKKAAREIITKFAASVSEVPEDKRAEVIAALAEI